MIKINYLGKCLLIELDGKNILVIGDLHLGYSESLRESGVFIPGDLYKEVIEELNLIFEHISKIQHNRLNNYQDNEGGSNSKGNIRGMAIESKMAEKSRDDNELNRTKNNYGNDAGIVDEIILLGDLKHEFGKIMKSEWEEVLELIDYLSEKVGKNGKIVIVKGNHDVFTESITKKKGVEIKDYYVANGIAFVHGDRKLEGSWIYDKKIEYWIMGHGHPAVRISDGAKEEKYKCFLTGRFAGKEIIIVPSFFSVNEGTDARDFELGLAWDFDLMNFNVKAIGDDLEVLNFGKLKSVK